MPILGNERGNDRMTHQLTNREKEVLALIAQGLRNVDIAQALGISIFIVQNHICHIFRKLNVSNRIAAVGKCWEEIECQEKNS